MLKQSIGMTENDARQIAEMYLSRYNPTYWDGSGEVPFEANFDICRVAVDSMYNGCTLDIQLCKPDACPVSGRVMVSAVLTKRPCAMTLVPYTL